MGIKSLLILNYSRGLESSSLGVQPCSSLIQPFKAWSQCYTATPTAPHQLFPQIYENNHFLFQTDMFTMSNTHSLLRLFVKGIYCTWNSLYSTLNIIVGTSTTLFSSFTVTNSKSHCFVTWERNYLYCKKHFLNHNFVSCFPVKILKHP